MMSRNLSLLTVVILAVLALGAVTLVRQSTEEIPGPSRPGGDEASDSSVAPVHSSTPASARAPSPSDAGVPAGLETRIKPGDPNVRSAEEAEWLDQNWYPSKDVLEAGVGLDVGTPLPPNLIPRSSWDLMVARAAVGDPERRDEAQQVMRKAAEFGSVYALRLLGDSMIVAGDHAQANAYYAAAQIRGDWELYNRWSGNNTGVNRLAMMRGLAIIHDINLARQRIGLPPLPTNLRPGWETVIQGMEQQYAPSPEGKPLG